MAVTPVPPRHPEIHHQQAGAFPFIAPTPACYRGSTSPPLLYDYQSFQSWVAEVKQACVLDAERGQGRSVQFFPAVLGGASRRGGTRASWEWHGMRKRRSPDVVASDLQRLRLIGTVRFWRLFGRAMRPPPRGRVRKAACGRVLVPWCGGACDVTAAKGGARFQRNPWCGGDEFPGRADRWFPIFRQGGKDNSQSLRA